MQTPKHRPRRRNAELAAQFAGPPNRDLLPLYLSAAQNRNTAAARQLLELCRRELVPLFSPDDGLALYVANLLARVIAVKDARDRKCADSGKLGNEASYYRALAMALNLIEPIGRRKRIKEAIDKAALVAESMTEGTTMEVAIAEVERAHRQFGGKDAYARNRTAGRASVAMKKLGKR